ncbi:PBP1A family penicillin-binding protein [Candidatus Uhrbacteria bacterium]|nr:PBP1A family penicillin-binding protein [Candidatus Uhrbacteria bacterium]
MRRRNGAVHLTACAMRLSYNYHKEKKRPIRFTKKRIPSPRKAHSLYGVRRISRVKKFIGRLAFFFVAAFLIGAASFVGLIGWYSRDLPDPNKLIERAVPQSTKIYDRSGARLLYEIHGEEQRSLVTINEIPDHLKWATLVAEDKNFYTHKGFDIKGIIRSIVIDIVRGGKVQGGSTITQQFIKNALLTREKTFTRKIKELALAYQLEQRFSKDQILQLYFNEIPYGSTAYGAQAAAHRYFGKSARELTLAQSAILASLPKAPTYYSPWGTHRDALFSRQHYILDALAENGYITEEDARLAKEEKISFQKPGQAIVAPHFVLYVKELLTELFGEKVVEEGGLTVITSLDYDKQMIAEEVVRTIGEKNLAQRAKNAALVSLDARNGHILALVGSRDYFDESIDGNVNVALRPRQPGSSIKPIIYAAAFQKGYTPSTIIYDVLTDFDTTGKKPYKPKNYTEKEYGPVTLKKALAGSLNISAVKTLYLVGVHSALEFAASMGYTTFQDTSRYGLSLVLGGGEVTLLEHTAAFSAFAQGGTRVSPLALLRVEDNRGRILYKKDRGDAVSVIDKEVAYQITDILSDAKAREYMFGTNANLTLPDRVAAVKTGTTNDFRDAWTVGYTPSIVTGVWVGNNDNKEMANKAGGSAVAAPIWHEYMKQTLTGAEKEPFPKPADIKTGKPVLDGTLLPHATIFIDSSTGSLATALTPPETIITKPYTDLHSLLAYIDKDNPLGDAPANPASDPQFEAWESGVAKWAKKNGFTSAMPQAQKLDGQPFAGHTLTIISPQENDTITQNNIAVTISTSSDRGIQKVEYYFDTTLVDTVLKEPFLLSSPLSGVENGFHTILIKSYDNGGSVQSASITVNLLLIRQQPTLFWKSPQPLTTHTLESPPSIDFDIILPEGYPLSSIQKISLFYTLEHTEDERIIATILNPDKISYSIPWSPSSGGNFLIRAFATDKKNSLLFQKRFTITIK